jgi:hypothetical protein
LANHFGIGTLAERGVEIDDGYFADNAEPPRPSQWIARFHFQVAATYQLNRLSTHQVNRRNNHRRISIPAAAKYSLTAATL